MIDGANPSDPGVALLADAVVGVDPREILLVACGEIPGVGPGATRLVLDVRELGRPGARAFALDPDAGLHGYAHALVWPRAHLGKDFTFACLARGALALREGGQLHCAVRKNKGAESIAEHIAKLFGGVDIVVRDRGYRRLRAVRGPAFDRELAGASLAVRHRIEDPLLGELSLCSAPGVFARRELDLGTRCLIEHAAAHVDIAPARVLDLGAGVGPLALWAAHRWPTAQVLAIEANLLAAGLCEDNARAHGLADRVHVLPAAGLPEDTGEHAAFAGAIDLALVNPPTHAPPRELSAFVDDALRWLSPRGRALFVVSRAASLADPLRRIGATAQAYPYARYTVVAVHRPC